LDRYFLFSNIFIPKAKSIKKDWTLFNLKSCLKENFFNNIITIQKFLNLYYKGFQRNNFEIFLANLQFFFNLGFLLKKIYYIFILSFLLHVFFNSSIFVVYV
jgi:hypothetical protein